MRDVGEGGDNPLLSFSGRTNLMKQLFDCLHINSLEHIIIHLLLDNPSEQAVKRSMTLGSMLTTPERSWVMVANSLPSRSAANPTHGYDRCNIRCFPGPIVFQSPLISSAGSPTSRTYNLRYCSCSFLGVSSHRSPRFWTVTFPDYLYAKPRKSFPVVGGHSRWTSFRKSEAL